MTGDRHHETVRPGIKAYFTAGTPIVSIAREPNSVSIRVGDEVWSRDEFDADARAGLKVVEELFTRHSQVLRLHVGSAIIGTTAEHPFWVVGKGWVNANELAPGDTLIGKDGQEISVSQVEDTGEWATVYNMRVADWHTYFVGAAEWGFSVWAHNATYQRVGVTDDLARMALEHRKSGSSGKCVLPAGQNEEHAVS